MQPDLLSPEKEENQPEQPASQDAPQPEPAPFEPGTKLSSPDSVKKKSRLPAIALGTCIVLLVGAIVWVGYWAYTLSTELAATQQQLTTLKTEHEKLQSDYTALTSEKEKLNADLTQSQKDLEKANADLAAAQTSLTKSQDQNKTLDAKIDKAAQLTEILYSWATMTGPTDIFKVDTLIKETKDQNLMKQWSTLMNSPSEDGFGKFFVYLISSTRDNLK